MQYLDTSFEYLQAGFDGLVLRQRYTLRVDGSLTYTSTPVRLNRESLVVIPSSCGTSDSASHLLSNDTGAVSTS